MVNKRTINVRHFIWCVNYLCPTTVRERACMTYGDDLILAFQLRRRPGVFSIVNIGRRRTGTDLVSRTFWIRTRFRTGFRSSRARYARLDKCWRGCPKAGTSTRTYGRRWCCTKWLDWPVWATCFQAGLNSDGASTAYGRWYAPRWPIVGWQEWTPREKENRKTRRCKRVMYNCRIFENSIGTSRKSRGVYMTGFHVF